MSDFLSALTSAVRGNGGGAPPGGALPPGALTAMRGAAPAIGNTKSLGTASLYGNDARLIEVIKRAKHEAFADRWIFERQWTRILHYLNNRQWLAPYSRREGWRDARLAKGIPKPTNSKPREVDQSIRAMFASIRFGTTIRPSGQNQKSIATAAVCDDLMPLLHDAHSMNSVMTEFDTAFINLGSACLYTYWDYDAEPGMIQVPYETCNACGAEFTADEIVTAGQKCPACGGRTFTKSLDDAQNPKTIGRPKGCGQTKALSPLEYAFPLNYQWWREVPFVILPRWRDKRYFEEHPQLKDLIGTLKFQKDATDRTIQIFKSMPFMSDIPGGRAGYAGSSYGGSENEGIPEFELHHRPTPEHPEGLIVRWVGDSNETIIHLEEDEGLPGPLPYHDQKGNPLFTFTHASYHHVTGRVLGSGVHDPVMNKYDALNRLDSLIEMIIMRMAAPQWMVPKGAEVAWLGDAPGLPGLLLEWNAQIAGVNGRPEKVPGIGVDASIMSWRKQLLDDIEESTGTYDILRGAKPSGVDAFSAMQLLVESGMRRFSNAFQARGDAYRDWAEFALELERDFGPDDRTLAVMSPHHTYAFKTFKKADLGGAVNIVIEDGTYTPKTALGVRAAIEHLNQLGFLDKSDPDQRYKILQEFGQTSIAPTQNAHVTAALKKQQDFIDWIMAGSYKAITVDPQTGQPALPANYPLKWRRWYDPTIHRVEFVKWANSDVIMAILADPLYQAIEGLLISHLMEIDLAIAQKATSLDPGGLIDASLGQPGAAGAPGAAPAAGGGAPGGAGRAMANSNANSAPAGNTAQPVPPGASPVAAPV